MSCDEIVELIVVLEQQYCGDQGAYVAGLVCAVGMGRPLTFNRRTIWLHQFGQRVV
jgi:hypothetical protein